MKPEPLTKEKIDEKVIWNRFWSIIRKLPIMKMRRKHDKEVIGLQVAFKGEILHIQRDIKSAVEWLLKEIEKNQNELKEQYKKARKNTQRTWIGGAIGGLEVSKDLIKKAFSGVIENV